MYEQLINNTSMRKIIIKNKHEELLLEELNKRNDIKAERIKKFLSLPDLTKSD